MQTKNKLYQATKGSGLLDYCLFNKNDKDNEKNKFLALLSKSLIDSEWFNPSDFTNLGSIPFDKRFTQVPFADKETQEEEFNSLKKVFTEEEILELIKTIENLKSYGVKAIKELMDNEEEFNKSTSMRTAFANFFKSKK